MQHLDAILAFVLTLAALATVVTIILEACMRMARMRKKNFVEVMKLLDKEISRSKVLDMGDLERCSFLVRVLENPAEKSVRRPITEAPKTNPDQLLKQLGRDRAAGHGVFKCIWLFVLQLFGDKKRSGVFDEVSLEYMLRCLADADVVKSKALEARNALNVEFNRIARKYEEFSSSVSASFKRHAQSWSIGIGIGLAVAANINGLKIYQTYLQNSTLTSVVIEKQQAFENAGERAQKAVREIRLAEARVWGAKTQLVEAEKGNDQKIIEEKRSALARANKALEAIVDADLIMNTMERAKIGIGDLEAMGIPIGWKYHPFCKYTGISWQVVLGRIIVWQVMVLITGVLIGLGAPFWFDVAKRLSQIRKGLQSASASTEYRLSASNANGDREKRKKIVRGVLDDAAREAELPAAPAEGG